MAGSPPVDCVSSSCQRRASAFQAVARHRPRGGKPQQGGKQRRGETHFQAVAQRMLHGGVGGQALIPAYGEAGERKGDEF